MTRTDLENRTRDFASIVLQLVNTLPRSMAIDVIARQLIRSATSIGANYRSSCRSRSKADFIARITVVEEEADECCYWLDLLDSSGIIRRERIDAIRDEARQLTAIFTAIGRTSRRNLHLHLAQNSGDGSNRSTRTNHEQVSTEVRCIDGS
jgi:four helix bundle protein